MWVYFTPLPRPGFPFRGLLLPHSRPRLVAEVVPSRRLTELRCLQLPTSSTLPGPALRAFPLCENPQSLLRCLAAASIRSPPGLPLLQVFALDAVEAPSRLLPLVVLSATLSSHCHRRPSAFRHRARLASLEAAYLLEVFDLPAISSCPEISDEVHHSASVDHLAMTGFRLFVPAVQFDRQPSHSSVFSFAFRRTQRGLSRRCTNSRTARVKAVIVWFQVVVPV